MPQQRIPWVDYAKAIAILGIIVGHFAPYFSQVISWAHPLCELMYSFHVAAFFLLSGYTTARGIMPARKVARLARGCFLPYLVAGMLSAVTCMLFTPNKSFMEWGAALVYASGAYNGELLWGYPFGAVVIGAVWFLPALFIGKLVSTLISKLPITARLLVTAGLFVVGMETAKILFLPMDIQQGLCASWWITCGMTMSQTKVLESKGTLATVAVAATAALGACYMAALWLEVWREPMYCNSTYPNGVLDMFGTTFATVLVVLLAKLVVKAPRLVRSCAGWIGHSTLPIFCWHAVSIAPGVFLSDWLLSLVDGDTPATAVFTAALAADIAFSLGMAWVSSKVPGLRSVFFPSKSPFRPVEHIASVECPSVLIEDESQAVSDIRHVPVVPAVMVVRTGKKMGNLSVSPPQEAAFGVTHMSNGVASTDKKAEDVIVDAKHAAGYVPPEHKTKKRKTDKGHLRVKTKADPSRHLGR